MLSTPLHDACRENKVSLDEILELLNKRPDDVMKKDIYRCLPIHLACATGGSFEVIDALIKAYPDGLKAPGSDGRLPIHLACANEQSFEVIDALIKAYPDGLKVRDNVYKRLPIHWAFVAEGQSFEVIDALIKEYPDGLKAHDNEGFLPTHLACVKGQSVEVIDALIKAYPDGLKEWGGGRLPIHLACANGQSFEVIDALIKAYPDGLKEWDGGGRLPIHWSCEQGQSFEVIEALIDVYPDGLKVRDVLGRLPKVPNNKERMPIHYAFVKGQSFEVIDALIKEYPDGLKVPTSKGHLPIHWACAQGQSFEVIDALIKAYPDGLKVPTSKGQLPIHLACANGQSIKVINALIKEYPDGLKVPTSKGHLPIHWACAQGQSFEVIDALIKAYPDGLKVPTSKGQLPIHLACANGQSIEVIDALIKIAYPFCLFEWDGDGRLPIHLACANGQSFEVIHALIKEFPSILKQLDQRRRLPIHWACANGQSFEVIDALIKEYPDGLGKSDTDGKTPFEWDYEESCGGHFKEFIQNLSSRLDKHWEDDLKTYDERKKKARMQAISVASMLNIFSGYAVDDKDLYNNNHLPHYSLHLPPYEGILTHCKNYVPLDILRIGFLDEKTLESHSFTEWLNGMLCKRNVVFMMVLELYLHMAWIYTFVSASHIYFVKSDELLGWRPTALLIFAAMFLLEEMSQFIRLFVTGELLHYMNWWNWIDVVTCVMVIVSAARFLDEDSSIDGRLLMTTGCFQSLLLLSYLKKTFFPFSKFVSGVIKIIWAVLPFLVVSAVTLLTFSFMYFVQDQDKLKKSDLELVFNNTNNSNLEDDASFASLMLSFQTVFDKFAGGAKESLSALDFFFGIIVVIVLLNVIIAVVSGKWDEAEAEANASFWKYRLDLIIEKTRGSSLDWLLSSSLRGYLCSCPCSLPSPPSFNCDWSRWIVLKRSRLLDIIFIDQRTVGTTLEEFKLKLAVKNKEDGIVACIMLLMECFVFFVLGFPTFGLLWPKFIRQMIFTPSKPKESSDAVSEQKRETFEREIAKKVVDQNELLAEYKKDQNESLAEYKKTVSELSQKVSAQNDLLEQLLKKIS
ncbi:ankyrin repeat domain-containing protein [Skeletonema marinoi]|uniref:Ankyrin repeat domain-containing protein n=1 Tax=Skeletonema marinoi TaxID=267567 RepID=A0AAD8Y2A5_9STRA|nr:ankyrin repeat domain-containing protein [Skeletonema marinoi]